MVIRSRGGIGWLGVSPVITTMILVGAVMVIGIAFMSYTVSLSNIQGGEVKLRNILNEESMNVVAYVERDNSSDSLIDLYIGITKVIPEVSRYYIAIFTTDSYGIQAKTLTTLPLSSINVGVLNYAVSQITTSTSNVFVITSFGDYIPLSFLRDYEYITLYEVEYQRPSTLIKVTIDRSQAGSSLKDYILIVIFQQVSNNYYEILQLPYRVR